MVHLHKKLYSNENNLQLHLKITWLNLEKIFFVFDGQQL